MKIDFYEYIGLKDKQNILLRKDATTFSKLGFENFFICLKDDELSFLNSLYKFAEMNYTDYIDSKIWYSFLISNEIKIPPITEEYIYIGNDETSEITITKGGRNINNIIKVKKQNKTRLRPLFDIDPDRFKKLLIENMPSKEKDSCIVLHKSAISSNKIESFILLFSFIFSSEHKFYLKKCNVCQKYYITTKSDNRYCKRVKDIFDNDLIPCNERVATLQKTREYKNIMKKNKALLQKMNYDTTYSDDYVNEYINKRNEARLTYFKTRNINDFNDFFDNYLENNPKY